MIKLRVNALEVKQLLIWAENTISGGHYGDHNVILPEERITLDKLKNNVKDGAIDVNERDLKIMIIWSDNAIGGEGMISEEISLIEKLKKAMNEIAK